MSVSIVIPSIRTHLWSRVLDSLAKSCKLYDYEVIFCGPFKEDSLLRNNVRFVESYYTVPVSIQLGIRASIKNLVFQTVDDCFFLEDSLDVCLSYFGGCCSNKDILNMRYSEGPQFAGHIRTKEEWLVKNCPEFNLPFINQKWSTTVQPLMNRRYLIDMGGLDCRWEYSNHSHHDLSFRCQANGSTVHHSPVGVSRADHMPNETGDHKPIHNAQNNDIDSFNELWSQEREAKIDFYNYQNHLDIWARRFSKQYSSYKDMAISEGYDV